MTAFQRLLLAAAALLLVQAGASAQDAPTAPDAEELDALRAELAETRTQLAEAARRMAEIQRKLVAEPAIAELQEMDSIDGIDIERIRVETRETLKDLTDMPPRLGVILAQGDDGTTRVIGVTPGSGAERAGIRSGDVIVSVAGSDVENRGGQGIRNAMSGIEPGETVEVVVRRGDNGEEIRALAVETSSVEGDIRLVFERLDDLPEIAARVGLLGLPGAPAPMLPRPPNAPGFWVLGADTDLVTNHSGLESYFGTGDGVIVLRVDDDNPMRLEDGDVILTLDREPVESPVDLARKLMQRPGGERVALEVMRDGVLTEVGGTIPERSGPLGRLAPFSNPLEPAPVAPRPPTIPPRAL